MDHGKHPGIVADARMLPFRDNSVDLIITNPPYSRSVEWEDYIGEMNRAKKECRRVLAPSGKAYMLLQVALQSERWFVFNKRRGEWRHTGHTVPPEGSSIWRVIPERQLRPIIECHSRQGDRVLDPFTGAGNIPQLATSMGRTGIGSGI